MTLAYSLEYYKTRFRADPMIYSFDLAGYGTMQFSENKIFAMAGFSDKVFSLMNYLEKDKKALLKTIQKVEL